MTEPAPSAVSVSGLTVEIDGRRILGPIDLEVAAGEQVLLVGASGSGKTTLLRALAGLGSVSAGAISLAGTSVTADGRHVVAPEARGVGLLFQGGALWPHMSVAKTLAFVARRCPSRTAGATGSTGDVGARVAELVKSCRLTGLEDRLPGTLSGGEKQRLALARAIVCEPRLLLLDEPLGPLDAELRGELVDLLADLHARLGWTTIHVTHDPAQAARIATRTLRMADGRLVPDAGASTP